MEWLAAISPLSPLVSLSLILLSGVTSMISASLGVGGSLPRWLACSGVSALVSGLLEVSRLR